MSDADTERARALLAECETRGAIKRLGAWLDAHGDATVRAALVAEGNARGADLPEEAAAWPGKKLLRLALAREQAAQIVRSPIARDEAFICAHCGAQVPPHGRTARDHCPRCLWSLHVDVVPGDRAADCGGGLRPLSVEPRADRWMIHYRCTRCGAARINQALLDGEPADDWAEIARLSAAVGEPR